MSKDDHPHLEPCPICQPTEFRSDAAGEAISMAESLMQFLTDDKELTFEQLTEPTQAFLAGAIMTRSALLEVAALLRADMLIPVERESDEEGNEIH